MSLVMDGIMHLDGQMLPFSRDMREALGAYARRRWPLNTSVHASKAWGISKTTAANVLKGHASDATLAAILRSGGWALALPVLGAVIGHPVHAFFNEQIEQAAREQERAQRHEQLARAAYGRLAGSADHHRHDRDASPPTGEARRSFGAVGAETSRRLD